LRTPTGLPFLFLVFHVTCDVFALEWLSRDPVPVIRQLFEGVKDISTVGARREIAKVGHAELVIGTKMTRTKSR
jgi:hypothetical protein